MNKSQLNHLFRYGVFPENDSPEKRLETGISWIFIGKKYAYKLKKPVKYSFLDFSTLRKRKFFCEEEVRLNRRLTKGIYLGVLSIYKRKNVFFVGENGKEVVDYLVWMKKMDPFRQMDFLLKENKVTKAQIKQIAFQINRFHFQTNKIYTRFDKKGMEDNFNDIRTIKGFVKVQMGNRFVQRIDSSIEIANAFIRENKKLFQRRVEEGFVRDCHGDMHSGNIFLYNEPVIFDCIEFDQKLRHIDVLNEIAFLCMDLDFFQKPELGEYFLKNYKQSDTKGELFKLFIFYKCLHANVRAKVNGLRARKEKNKNNFRKCIKEAKAYIHLMYEYSRILNS